MPGLEQVTIRNERAPDRAAVRRVIFDAFGQQAEVDLVDRLRRVCPKARFLLAELAGEVVGHICFSPAVLDSAPNLPVMGLAPMAVAPARQRCGIGSRLVRRGLEDCKQAGYVGVVVLGHPEYYPRFGFVPASRFGLRCEYEVGDETFMAEELVAGAFVGHRGLIRYHEAFLEL